MKTREMKEHNANALWSALIPQGPPVFKLVLLLSQWKVLAAISWTACRCFPVKTNVWDCLYEI